MKKHLKKIIIISTVLLLVAALLIVYFAFFYKSPEERAAIAAQNAALAAHRALMTAHTASNTELLESDKFFDKPDFMIYEIGGEKIECTPEEQAAIYAEFEKMVSDTLMMHHSQLSAYVLDEEIPKLKQNGAVRFCYNQRRKYTGEYPHPTPVYVEGFISPDGVPYEFTLWEYYWEDFTFDEVLIGPHGSVCDIVLGEGATYKLVRGAYNENPDDCIQLSFNTQNTMRNFDLAIKKILKIEERFPELLVEEK